MTAGARPVGDRRDLFADIDDVRRRLDAVDYLADDGLASAVFFATTLQRPLLLEGEPGVGKTSAAKAIAAVLDAPLIRLQCYEGLTVSESLYEWNYQRQLLSIRLAEAKQQRLDQADLFTEDYLSERPILKAVRYEGPTPAVLLVDEIDRADDEFEALLLEFLGEASVTVPELGTFTATNPPITVLTSNRSRELHDALRRRCLYHWIEFPEPAHAAQVVRRTVPSASEPLVGSTTEFIGHIRGLDLDKRPGLAEAIDWVSALAALGATELVREDALRTIGSIAKTPGDRTLILQSLDDLDPHAHAG